MAETTETTITSGGGRQYIPGATTSTAATRQTAAIGEIPINAAGIQNTIAATPTTGHATPPTDILND